MGTIATKSSLAPAGFRDAQVSDRAVLLDVHVLIVGIELDHPSTPKLSLSIALFHYQRSDQILWLGAVFELLIELSAASEAQAMQAIEIENLKPSRMNRLQRSLVKDRVPAVAKGTTSNVAAFLIETLKDFETYLQNQSIGNGSWKAQKRALASLLRYWWDTFYLATSKNFEEATFQAHLAIGTDLLPRLVLDDASNPEHAGLIKSFGQSLNQEFTSGFRLTTGLSMEALWKGLRPIVMSSWGVLDNLTQMEQLATRFDD